MPEDLVVQAIRKRRGLIQKNDSKETKRRPTERTEKKATRKKHQRQDVKTELIINPLTKRQMKVGGRAHKAYLKKLNEQTTERPKQATSSTPQNSPRKKRKIRDDSDSDDFESEEESFHVEKTR